MSVRAGSESINIARSKSQTLANRRRGHYVPRMSMLVENPTPPARRVRKPLPLENGDRLTSAEFLRRYEAMPEINKAELIEGHVHMAPPLRADAHSEPDMFIHLWLGYYASCQRNVKAYANPTLVLDADNTPQPDSVLCTAPRRGSHVWLNEKGYLCGRPELVCEVAASSASIDLHDKLNAYRRNGIAEYLVWVVAERRIRWFALVEQEYVEMKERAGVVVSRVFPKLALDVKAALKLDGAKVLATLRRHLGK